MDRIVEILKLVITLLPVILTAVKQIEEALPVEKQGAVKAELLKGAVDVAVTEANIDNNSALSTSKIQSVVGKIGSIAVLAYKAVGLFK